MTLHNTSRLFLALWPETFLQHNWKRWRDKWVWPASASLVPPESLHLTLHFLGNVANSRLPELEQELNVPFDAFDLSFSQAQMWSHGVVVLEPDSMPVELLKLHTSLATALQRLDLPVEERSFHPHITLARHAAGVNLPANAQNKSLQWHVNTYALIQSGQSQKYSVLQKFKGG